MKHKFAVRMIYEDGSYKILETYQTYEKADKAVDRFSEKYPNAWVDIFEFALVSV